MKVKTSFSLFEILVVLSLIMIVIIVTVPASNFLGNFFLRSEIEKLEVFYYYLQRLAMASGRRYALIFDLQKNAYSFQKSEQEKLFQTLENGVRFGFLSGVLGPPSKPTQKIDGPIIIERSGFVVSKISAESDNLTVEFLPSGKITAGSIYFVDRQGKKMGALTCSPSQVSYLRRYIYGDKDWIGF